MSDYNGGGGGGEEHGGHSMHGGAHWIVFLWFVKEFKWIIPLLVLFLLFGA